MKKIKVGIVGAGTVGAGLAEILKREKESIQRKTGIDIELSAVCDKNTGLKDRFPDVKFVSDYNDLISDPSISIIAELIGGKTVAYDVVKAALLAGKTVVTANKALLSEKGEELYAIAEEKGLEIGYEASVGGTIPVIRSIRTSLAANQFDAVYGILNGTTNFILTKMEEEHLEYSAALKEAQRLGFAESDPSFDVEGIDAAHKLSILIGLAFERRLPISEIAVEGITNISKTEIETAASLGYKIKLLGIAKRHGNAIEASVRPAMVPFSHPISGIRNEMNAVYLETNYSGPLLFSGKGAGSLPTASAVVSDIIFYGSRISAESGYERNLYPKAEAIPETERTEKFYIRFEAKDQPGVLGEITSVLGRNNISIATLHQKEIQSKSAEIIMITHPGLEKNLRKSMDEILKAGCLAHTPVVLRLQEN